IGAAKGILFSSSQVSLEDLPIMIFSIVVPFTLALQIWKEIYRNGDLQILEDGHIKFSSLAVRIYFLSRNLLPFPLVGMVYGISSFPLHIIWPYHC
ncbi:MAG: hypothetical protein WA902_03395, partial [Thermosynechococcaceae cyanobacterium]